MNIQVIPPFMSAQIAIDAKHDALGGDAGLLGPAIEDMHECPNSTGYFRRYRDGMIYWSRATDAHEIHGAILDKWSSMGFEQSLLGFPLEDETGTPDGVGRFNRFHGGMIYWTPATGAHEVHGAILEKWSWLGFEQSFLGYPVDDETGSSDGVGRFSRFQGGTIYWTPNTGAHEVHGAIQEKWVSLGAEHSFLGYPTTDETDLGVSNGRYNNFVGGQIAWSPSAGAAVCSCSFDPNTNGGITPQGLGDGGVPEVRRRVIASAHMDITDDEWIGSDEHGAADNQTEVFVSNRAPQGLLSLVGKAGGEVRIELEVSASIIAPEGDVLVSGQVKLFEGTSEETDDLDGTTSINFAVPRDGVISQAITVRNQDEGGDFANIRLAVSNFAA